eukprot:5509546-Pleurochrysis_carterae.AAC.1
MRAPSEAPRTKAPAMSVTLSKMLKGGGSLSPLPLPASSISTELACCGSTSLSKPIAAVFKVPCVPSLLKATSSPLPACKVDAAVAGPSSEGSAAGAVLSRTPAAKASP